MTNQPVTSGTAAAVPGGRFESLALGLGTYYLTSLIVVLGVVFGYSFIPLAPHPLANRNDLLGAFANWDGKWYVRIAEQGYSYDPKVPSSAAFFPAYPLLGRAVAAITGMRTELALLLVSHLCLALAFVTLAAHLRHRYRDAPPALTDFTLLALGLFPTAMFFRMAYTESLFLCVLALFLYALERRWPLATIALIVGFATACRAPGVALLPPFALHVWQRSSSARQRTARLCWLMPLACWGVAAFMLYQWANFGDPFAFVKTQATWRMRPPTLAADKLTALVTLAPIWSIFDPPSPAYWERFEPGNFPLFSLHFANPLYFLFAAGATVLGWYKGWLRPCEILLAAGLLLIPYLASSYEMYMAGAARFAVVVLPVYLVLGQLLYRIPPVLAATLVAHSGFLLAAYAALFAAWHRFF